MARYARHKLKKTLILHMINDETCPKCQGSLFYRVTRRGDFVSCNNYPKCDFHRPLYRAEYDDFNRYLNSKKRRTDVKGRQPFKQTVEVSIIPQRSMLELQSLDI